MHRKIMLNDKPKNQEEDNKGKIKVGMGSKFIFHAIYFILKPFY